MAVLGVDACKDGWVGIRLASGGAPTALCGASISELVAVAGSVSVVAVDIPIGLPNAGARTADQRARDFVGPRRSSVFATPARVVLEAQSYEAANELSRQVSGTGLSRQSYALRPKILEVDSWRPPPGVRLVEIHPEVSFRTMAGTPLVDAKTTWAGATLRRDLLAAEGIVLDGDLGLSGRRVGIDDVLDAAAAAWTASRVATGCHVTLPEPPQRSPDGTEMAIYA